MVITVDGQIAEDDTVVTWWTMRVTHSKTTLKLHLHGCFL
jgi:hypothetical protein